MQFLKNNKEEKLPIFHVQKQNRFFFCFKLPIYPKIKWLITLIKCTNTTVDVTLHTRGNNSMSL